MKFRRRRRRRSRRRKAGNLSLLTFRFKYRSISKHSSGLPSLIYKYFLLTFTVKLDSSCLNCLPTQEQKLVQTTPRPTTEHSAITCCSCYRMPQHAFFLRTRDLLVCQKRTPSPFPGNCCNCNSGGILYCFAILDTSVVRNRPGSNPATSRDFLRKRLQRAFTRANQLR